MRATLMSALDHWMRSLLHELLNFSDKEPPAMPKNKSIHQHLPFVVFLVALLLPACSSVPSESEGKKALDGRLAETNLLRVNRFTKTNGISDERTYTMMYKAELECLHEGSMFFSGLESHNALTCKNKGQIGEIEGRLVFEKTENGWRIKPK